MSVTISPATHALPHTYGTKCYADDLLIGAAATYEAGQAITRRHALICEECRTWGAYTVATPVGHTEAPEVNLSNVNAARVLAVLGHRTEDLCGTAKAEDIISRAGGYLTLVESPAIAWDEYMVRKVTQVREVAAYALAQGLDVSWG